MRAFLPTVAGCSLRDVQMAVVMAATEATETTTASDAVLVNVITHDSKTKTKPR